MGAYRIKLNAGAQDHRYEMNFSIILWRYLTRYFVIDSLCCFPQFVFLASFGFYKAEEDMNEYLNSTTYQVMLYLKLFKFFLIPRIFDVTKTAQTLIARRFYMKRHLINNIFLWTRTLIQLYMLIHLFACIIIYERQLHYKENLDKWMTDRDIEISEIDPMRMTHLYVEMVYFVTTTLTTVGYGDYSAIDEPVSRLIMSVM